ncbi:hypothetical protein RIR_jg32170.t1 [Rhizophagus irregularis DAOM 181602=DAOM 197198]|nr:hypothetical protein RIR_jg32170.t1 [Rhizophagus irregularis DAOM 181602=DAOM 197198]
MNKDSCKFEETNSYKSKVKTDFELQKESWSKVNKDYKRSHANKIQPDSMLSLEFRNPKSTYSPAITKPKPPRPKSPSPSHVIKDVPVTELPMFR